MKQQITKEQMRELPDRIQAKLDLWMIRHGYENSFPNYSIGQMIEFLDDNRKTVLFITKLKCGDDFVWSTGSMACRGNWKDKKAHENDIELCDALWESVKEVLEEK